MGFLGDIWNGLKDGLELILRFYEGLFEPVFGLAAWGVAIILLTVTVRIFMIPLMVRQTKSMRSMQSLQPELKKIQEKYKADRSMMKTDPERYKKIKEKQREAQMELYQEHQVNPVGGCLPLLLQMPVFFALFQVLTEDGELAQDLASAPFLGIQSLTDTAQTILVGGGFVFTAAFAVVVLILLQVGTTFWSQKQMMARNTTAGAEQMQAQKLMLYIMPGFLGFLSFTFPIGVVLYWVTTNFWTMGQQAVIFRQVEAHEAKAAEAREEAKVQRAQRAHVEEVTDIAAPSVSRKKVKGTGPKNAGPSLEKNAATGGSPRPRKSSADGEPNGSTNGVSSGSRAARTRANAKAGSNGSTPGTGRPRPKGTGGGTSTSPGGTRARKGEASGQGTAGKGGTTPSAKGRPTKPGSTR